MSKKIEHRDKQKCYNCLHFNVREGKVRTKLECRKWNNAFVGAMWCKFWKSVNDCVI